MTRLLLLLILLISNYSTLAQTNGEQCLSAVLHQKMMQNNPEYAQRYTLNQQFTKEVVANYNANQSSSRLTVYTIPVVVHVIHLGEAVGSGSNISDAQIHSAIDNLNDAYANNSPYTGVDTEIQFCLASRAPGDVASSGINRIDGSGTSDYATNGLTTSGTDNEIEIKALSKWDNTSYYNIWIVSEIDGNNGGSGTQGFAYYPGAGSSVDGAVIMYNSFGYDPSSTFGYNLKSYTNRNVTTIHEMGHGFNLMHTFEGDGDGSSCPSNTDCSTEGDEVCDTPPHKRSSSDCDFAGTNSCDGGSSNALFVHNFMDYSSDDCQTEFTANQKTRMRVIFGGGGARESLTTSNGCSPISVPVSDFITNTTTGCAGSSVYYVDISDNVATSWSWAFAGGTPSTSTIDNPIVSYATAGTYGVTLTATNSAGAGNAEKKESLITIYDTPTAACVNGIQNIGNYGYSISDVKFNAINNTTTSTTNGYVDYSCTDLTTVELSTTYNLSITVGAAGGQDAFYAVYIDYNDNGTMNDAGETLMSGSLSSGSGATTFSTTVTIPADATTSNLLRMRVINDQFDLSGPCDNLFTGESEDYGVYVDVSCTNPSASITITAPACAGSSDGTATAIPSGGDTPYTYLWSNSQTLATATGLVAGAYTVTITENLGCTTITSATITDPSAITISTASTSITCNGASTGTAQATPSGGLTPYSYFWSNSSTATGVTTHSITGLTANTYTITVTDDNGCSQAENIIVSEATAITISTSSTSITCNGASTGTAQATPTGGESPYSYFWSNSSTAAGVTTHSITGLTANTYTVTITDNNGCSNTENITVSEASSITITPTIDDPSCFGNPDGSITNTIDGGTSPYTYAWNNSATTSSITGLYASIYTITVSDVNLCTLTNTVTVTDPDVLSLSISTNNISCNGASDYQANALVSGGTTPYTYLWNNSETTQLITGLTTGFYSATISDINLCSTSRSTSITEAQSLGITLTPTNIDCNGNINGVVTSTVSGGRTPYTYLWDDAQTTSNASGLAANTYSLTVTDINNCTISENSTITEPSAITMSLSSTSVTCNGASTGTASSTVDGGTTNYSYLWSNAATTGSINNLTAGEYTLTMSDANGCTDIQSATISEPSAITITPTVVSVTCYGGSDGGITVTPSGGTSGYLFLWGDTSTDDQITGLSVGNYSVTTTDANACVEIDIYTVTEPAVYTLSITYNNTSCNGASDWQANALVVGGTSSYNYEWSNAATTQLITGLTTGIYSATVTDANVCVISETVTITEAEALAITLTATNVDCNGNSTGSIASIMTGGGTPYYYLWDNSQTTASAINLSANTYSLTVTDFNSCTITESSTITEPSAITMSLSSTSVTCNGASTGAASSTVDGGTTNYSYLWSNTATTGSINSLTAGAYTLTLTDANGCTEIQSITVNEATVITLTPAITSVTCNGDNDGSITITPSGGTSGYLFLWEDASTEDQITGLLAGNYGVTVTDNNTCVEINVFTVTEPSIITPTITYNNTTCNGASDWQANILATGGISPYTYLWDNSATTQLITGLTTGIYSVTVSDINLCTATVTNTITDAEALALTLTPTHVDCNGNSTGNIVSQVTGGATPYSYLWNDNQTGSVALNLTANTYTVTVTDLNNCNITASSTITEPSAITMSLSSTPVTCVGQATGSASSTVSGGTTLYNYLWSNAATTSSINGLTTGNYSLTLTDASGCEEIQSISVSEQISLLATAGSGDLRAGSGNALSFNGSGNYVDFTGNISVNSHSMTAWINTTVTGSNQVIGSIFESQDEYSRFYVESTGTIIAQIQINEFGDQKAIRSSANVGDLTWHHIALTYDNTGDNLNLYIDGVLDNGTLVTNDPLTVNLSANDLHIGANRSLSGGYFAGSIDELSIWKKALSVSEIRDNLSAKLNTSNPSFCDIVGYYRFDEGSGSTLKDWIGTNNGTITGATYATSGAPIGDASAYDYSGSSSVVNIAHADGDDLTVTVTSGTLNGVHVYRVDETPSSLTGIDGTENDRYFGIFVAGTSINYLASYNYAGHSYGVSSSEDGILLYNRANNSVVTWTNTGAAPNTTTDVIEVSGETSLTNEFIIHLARSVWNGSVSTDWGTGANWTSATVPAAGANITIPDVTNQPILDQARSVGTILIETGATLDLSTFTLSIANNIENNGSIIYNTGTINFNGTDAQTINGSISFYNLNISNSGTGVTIESGIDNVHGTLTLIDGTLTTNDSLVFVSDASGTARIAAIPSGSSIIGNVEVQRYFPSTSVKGWRLHGSPVGAQTVAGWSDDIITSGFTGSTAPGNSWVSAYTFDETTASNMIVGQWSEVTNTTDIIANGEGLLIWDHYPQNKVVDLTGIVNTGDVSLPVTYTTSGWNLISNPYMSAIDWNSPEWTKSGINNALYIWNASANDWATYIAGVGLNGGSRHIASSQGFIVQTNAGSPVLTAKQGVKAATAASFFREATRDQQLRLEARNNVNGKKGETVIVLDSASTAMFDPELDAKVLKSMDGTLPNLTTIANNEKLAINSLPAINYADAIPLNLSSPSSSSVTIKVTDFPNQIAGACYQLHDLFTGNITDLTLGATYTFAYSDTSTLSRFEIKHCCSGYNVNLVKNDVLCNSTESGKIDLSIEGGTTPYSYNWNNNDQLVSNNSASITNIGSGIHSIVITDDNLCVQNYVVTVNDPNFTFSTEPTKASESASNDGSIAIDITSPELYSYHWSNNLSTQNIGNLSTGDYTVTVINNASGCSQIQIVALDACEINLASVISEPLCGESIGNIQITPSAGVGNYTYEWSSSNFSNQQDNLSKGAYTVTVTDNENCKKIETFNLIGTESISLTLSTTNPNCDNLDGEIIASAVGGNSNYTYSWSDDAGNNYPNNSTLFNLNEGIYTLIINDNDGCSTSTTSTLTKPLDILISENVVNTTNPSESDGAISLSVEGGSGNYSYNWSTGETSADISSLSEGVYHVTVTDSNGCEEIRSIGVSSGTTSIDEIEIINSCKVYPNPNQGIFNLMFNGKLDNNVVINIYNSLGQVVYSSNSFSGNVLTIELPEIENGVYVIKIQSNQHVTNKRFIVK